MTTVQKFPKMPDKEREDANPAIQLFGRRFYKGQTEVEYLAEFMLLFISKKKISGKEIHGVDNAEKWKGFPNSEELEKWKDEPLEYFPPLRLILKLFAFLGSSNLETRHNCHREQFKTILSILRSRIQTNISADKVLELLEQVLIGFEGITNDRTWCTHVFLPVSPGLIAGETIWGKVEGKKNSNLTWEEAIKGKKLFSFSKHDFMARGGEVLYLQLCNLFRRIRSQEIADFEERIGYAPGTSADFQIRIEAGLKALLQSPPAPALDALAGWIEDAAPWTREKIEGRKATCGWCPEKSWKEAYLFAYELANICEAIIDPLKKIEMLELCCIFQVLRSLCAQSARYWNTLDSHNVRQFGGVCDFAWIITSPETEDKSLKEAAKRNLARIQEMIHGALRNDQIDPDKKGSYKPGDEQGQELFMKLGKKIGFIAPWTGPGARFVLNDALTRYFVLALIQPGHRMRFISFQEILYRHYGMAANGNFLNRAIQWTYPNQNLNLHSSVQDWLEEKLTATSFLIPLSDAVSLVHNPYGEGEGEGEEM